MTLFPSRSWTLLFFKRRSMLLWWYASWAWIDRWLVWDCLYSRYWLLHSGQSCLVGNFKPSFQQCLKNGQFQCNLACSLSYLFLFQLMLVCLIFQPSLIILFLLSLPFIQQNPRYDPWLCHPCFWRLPLLVSALLLGTTSSNLSVLGSRYLHLGIDCSSFFWFGWC